MATRKEQREAAEYVRQSQGGERGERDEVVFAGYARPAPDGKSEVVDEYVYQDKDGRAFLQVRRYEPKAFLQFHWEEKWNQHGHWVAGKPAGPTIPYFLPSLIAAPPEKPVFICEGEKDADTVANLGDMEATCAPGGAGKWPDELNQWFAGRSTVFILQDNDDPGRRHARKVARNLAPHVGEVRIVTFPGLPPHGDVSDWLALGHNRQDLIDHCATAPVFQRAAIEVRGGESVDIVNRAAAALLDADTGIYQRGNELVRAIKLDKAAGQDREVRRAAGSTVLVSVTDTWLLEQMARHILWTRTKVIPGTAARDEALKVITIDPPFAYARTLLARQGEWDFPLLRGILTAPTLDRDGRIIQTSGYDAASGMLLDFKEGDFPLVGGNPTKEEAKAALQQFAERPGGDKRGVLRGFPFASEASKSVALSALLTALVRPNLGAIPLHAFDAPTAGTGKSMLAEMAGLLATGHRPPSLSQGKSPEEDEKRLSTVLHAGDAVILIDNCERPLEGDFLCSMLTQLTVQARILGLSERRILPSTALVLATGNNLALEGDVSRRAVICRLDAKVERPDARKFDFNAQDELQAERAALVVAGLTAMRAFLLAEDKPPLPPVGSFPDFDLIRGTLVWCGYADPADTRNAILDADPRKTELLEIMELWNSAFAADAVTVAAIGKRGYQDELYQALANATGARNGIWSAKSVGWWLKRNKDRVIGNRAFRSVGEREWKLEGGTM